LLLGSVAALHVRQRSSEGNVTMRIGKISLRPTLIAGLFLAAGAHSQAQEAKSACPPQTRADATTNTYGTTVLADPYQWLEDQNSKDTREWIDAENNCAESVLRKLPTREAISARLGELLRIDSFTTPQEWGGRFFFTKRLAGQDLSLIYMRKGPDAADEVLVDPLPWSKDHIASAVIEKVSMDGKYLYYGRREGGQDEVTVHVLDVDAHKDLPDVLPSANYFSVEPTPDRAGIYYAKATADGPRAYYHAMGTDPSKDQLVFGADLGKDKILDVELSPDGTYLALLVIHGSGSEQSEVYLQNLKAHGAIRPVVNDQKSLFYPNWAGNTLLLTTNWKAPKWHIFAVNPESSARDTWKEVIPEGDLPIEHTVAADGKIIAQYLRNATSEIKVYDPDGKNAATLALPTLGSARVDGHWSSHHVFYSFTSFNYPTTIFEADLKSNKSTVWAKLNSPMHPEDFQVQQVWYTSKDQTRVPMFLFSKKGLKQDGSNPVLLTGYGGFNVNITPTFSTFYTVFAERGGIVAVPSLRGGGEFGDAWHRAGMLEKKQNVFDDFNSAAEFLIAQKYTVSSKLSISGGSNGGLLVGASLTQRPDLYQAVVCVYPLEDMLRFQKFMMGPYWVPEYGTADNPEQFAYLLKYSPYQNVKDHTNYPAVLFITGDGDTRVAPLHARKMAARVQAATASGKPVLLLYDTKSGHSGGRPITKQIEEYTDILSFLSWQLGAKQN